MTQLELEKQTETAAEKQYRLMTASPVSRLVTRMALPTVGGMLVSSIYNMTDTYFVSQLGTSASAAVGVVFSLQSLIQAVGFGIGMGASSIISQKLGQRENADADRCASSAFCMGLVLGLVLMALGLSCLTPLMRLLGSTPTILPYARDFGQYILMGAPILCASFVLNNTLRAEGKAMLSMIGICCGNVLNLALDPLLIFVFRMGISGAAIATVLSQLVSLCVLGWFFVRGKSVVRISPRLASRQAAEYGHILRLGLPSICRQGFASVAGAALNLQSAPFGDAAVAAMSIANRIYLFVRSLLVGVGQGFQPVAGYNYGAGKDDRVKAAFRFTTVTGTVIATVFAAVIALWAPQLMALFRRDDPTVIAMGARALRMLCAVLPLLAYSTFVNQLLQCLGRSKSATFLASCRQGTLYLPLILLLPALWGITGVQLSQPVADALTFGVSIPFHIWFFRSPEGLNR